MKTWILAAVMMMGLTISAQHRDGKHEPLKPEQRAELRAKQMTLALNLNDKQQKDVQKLIFERSKKMEQARAQRKADREAGKKLTADERFALKNRRLDEQIAMKAEMRKILSAEQFAKWETIQKERQHKITNRHKNFKKGGRR
jgi:protein CpxP